jgi:hypothetical protein
VQLFSPHIYFALARFLCFLTDGMVFFTFFSFEEHEIGLNLFSLRNLLLASDKHFYPCFFIVSVKQGYENIKTSSLKIRKLREMYVECGVKVSSPPSQTF